MVLSQKRKEKEIHVVKCNTSEESCRLLKGEIQTETSARYVVIKKYIRKLAFLI